MAMRLLITGGAGCLGSNLIEHYLPQGHEVLVLDNFATSARETVQGIAGVRVVEGSVADSATVDTAFASFSPTHVIHSAAAYKNPVDWQEDAATNVLGSIYVAEASRRHGVRRLINFQTALCYGRPTQVPIPVDHPLQPITSYGISKTAGEQYLLKLLAADLQVVSLRLANVVAPRLAIGPLPTFYKRLRAGQGCFCSATVRDFLDVDDFVGLMDLALQDDAPTGAFNVSTGIGHSIAALFNRVADYLGISLAEPVPVVRPGADDIPEVVLDPARTEAAFGWRARVGFKESVDKMLAWYEAHGVTNVYSHLAQPVTAASASTAGADGR